MTDIDVVATIPIRADAAGAGCLADALSESGSVPGQRAFTVLGASLDGEVAVHPLVPVT